MAYVSQEMKKKLAPTIKAVLKEFGIKGSISVNNHSTLVVTIKEGALDFGGDYVQVNPYWIDSHYGGVARKFLNKLLDAMKGPDFFDHSDPQTDYFSRSHYVDINVGRWDQPYQKVS
tara:strand:+ start:489 stop:839 length:351 start_codon:yes stop_codon:yes gene_type:complete